MGHLGRTQKTHEASDKKLKAYACELEQKLEARTRELSEARGDLAEALKQQTATSEVAASCSRASERCLRDSASSRVRASSFCSSSHAYALSFFSDAA